VTTLFEYRGRRYPEYLKHGNAMQFIAPTAAQFCKGRGVDVGGGKWPLPGAIVVDPSGTTPGYEHSNALNLPDGEWDYIFSSHCLEHLVNPVAALDHWKTRLRPGGVLFLYLPHPDMRYWRPQHCRRHLHLFWPADVADMLCDLGFVNVIHGERDLAWSFAAVGFKP
jgi:SAM-dependent methyltransferase